MLQMSKREKQATGSFLTSIAAIFWIIIAFTVTYAIIRIFPKPVY